MSGIEWYSIPIYAAMIATAFAGVCIINLGLPDSEKRAKPMMIALGLIVFLVLPVWSMASFVTIRSMAEGNAVYELRDMPDGSREWTLMQKVPVTWTQIQLPPDTNKGDRP